MAKGKRNLSQFDAALRQLDINFPQDLFLASLREDPPRLHGFAFRFFLVLPLHSSEGKPVFTDEHLSRLLWLFDKRFGGCLAATSLSGAPFFGEYLSDGTLPVRDYHTVIYVYANPIEASDQFFQKLKAVLRLAPMIRQDEILIERSEVYLV